MRRYFPPALFAALLMTGLAACGDGGNFSQYPGFAEIRAQLASSPPNDAERALLVKHRPRLYIAAGAEPPLDFYKDYIAHGVLYTGDGKTAVNPSAATLNLYRRDKKARFVHRRPPLHMPSPVAYGGVYRVTLTLPEAGARRLTFLSYYFPFRVSGLPAGLGGFWRTLANVVADADDWHQLDHYTAVFLVLDGARPIAVMLQQHNYMRTYLLDGKSPFERDAIAVDAAIYSNELYPHRREPTRHRAAGFMGRKTVDYLLRLEEGGWWAATDRTHGVAEVKYELQFPPPNDAFYVFEGYLGEHRWLPGRDGPPGAMYRQSPKNWPLEVSMFTFYWREGDEEYARLWREMAAGGREAREKLKLRFARALKKIIPARR